MMEAPSTSETVNFYQVARRNNPGDSHLRGDDEDSKHL
jgi:hypothetical protein